jgi:hypothetical protein
MKSTRKVCKLSHTEYFKLVALLKELPEPLASIEATVKFASGKLNRDLTNHHIEKAIEIGELPPENIFKQRRAGGTFMTNTFNRLKELEERIQKLEDLIQS